MTFSMLVDIFYPSTGTVFSKEGVFQHQPQALALKAPVNKRCRDVTPVDAGAKALADTSDALSIENRQYLAYLEKRRA